MRQLMRRSDSLAIGGKADIARLPLIGRDPYGERIKPLQASFARANGSATHLPPGSHTAWRRASSLAVRSRRSILPMRRSSSTGLVS